MKKFPQSCGIMLSVKTMMEIDNFQMISLICGAEVNKARILIILNRNKHESQPANRIVIIKTMMETIG